MIGMHALLAYPHFVRQIRKMEGARRSLSGLEILGITTYCTVYRFECHTEAVGYITLPVCTTFLQLH